jgi:hypothetical protein
MVLDISISLRLLNELKGYHDFSGNDREWVLKQTYHNKILGRKQSHRDTNSTFPHRLYNMLESVGLAGCSHVISFQPHGRSFKIHDRKLFGDNVLPHYFKHQTKIASFLRQLNIYMDFFVRLRLDPIKIGTITHFSSVGDLTCVV